MSVRELRLLGDPVLCTGCDPVTRFDAALDRLIGDLMETVLLPGRAGLAAPQIGVSKAAFSYNVDGRHGYLINPVITETSGSYDGPEGCLSVPGITASTPRALHTVVTGADRRGEPVVLEGSGRCPAACSMRPITCAASCSWTGWPAPSDGPRSASCAASRPLRRPPARAELPR